MTSLLRALAVFSVLAFFGLPAAAETVEVPPPKVVTQSPDARPRAIEIVIQDHRFIPSALTLSPQERVILHIVNKDDSAEEFESRYLKREKIVPGNSAIDIGVGPLRPGVYDFKGDFHEDTAQGRITVPQTGRDYGSDYQEQPYGAKAPDYNSPDQK